MRKNHTGLAFVYDNANASRFIISQRAQALCV